MAGCTHRQWLSVQQEDGGLILQHGGRLRQISNSLAHPEEQYPSLLFFIGKKSKARALRALFPASPISSCRKYGIADVCIHTQPWADDHPLLIADSCPDFAQVKVRGVKADCHETSSHALNWPEEGRAEHTEVAVQVISRMLSLFMDVVCIFTHDCGGLEAAAQIILGWSARGAQRSSAAVANPRLLVVFSIPAELFDTEVLRFRLKLVSDPNFSTAFASLNVVNILGMHRSSPMMFNSFEEVLKEETRLARIERADTHTLFSMLHTAAFFDQAVHQFAVSPLEPFNFITASRKDNPTSPAFQHHLESFLRLCRERGLHDQLICDLIASAIILDGYPPDMHLFNPSEVFRILYRQICADSFASITQHAQISVQEMCEAIESKMIEIFSCMKSGGQSAAQLRCEKLGQHSSHLRQLQSNFTCLFCLARHVDHLLECGHGMCDTCVCIFGMPSLGKEYYFDLTRCLICQQEISFQARLLPPTCRVRFLGIDGGGSRGIVSLGFIDKLDQTLDLPYPVQENLDFGIGTSSGGLTTLGLFAKYWSPKKCLAFYRRFAKEIFPPRRKFRFSLCAIIKHMLASYFSDGKYDANVLEDRLKAAFGLGFLFEPVRSRPSGLRFAVTATTISDATLCLFSNYNIQNNQDQQSRYKHLRAKTITDEITLWEAARCTTAAPTYFNPKYLKNFGTFQDGALKYVNPVRPGLRMLREIWKQGDCDLVLSIGTGYEQKAMSPVASNVRNIFQDGALARFYRASLQSLSLNGQVSWEDHWHGLEEDAKHKHFRLNLPLVGQEPELDDVDKMEYLHDQVKYHLGDIEGIARAFKAVSFFFELDRPLVYRGSSYICCGSILSRSPDSRALVQNLTSGYPYAQFCNGQASIGLLSMGNLCIHCGRFRKPVTFEVRHPSDRVDIYLRFNRLFHRSISAFPQSMEWFVERQKLNVNFGQADHKSRLRPSSRQSACVCEIERYEKWIDLQKNKKRRVSQRVSKNKRRRV